MLLTFEWYTDTLELAQIPGTHSRHDQIGEIEWLRTSRDSTESTTYRLYTNRGYSEFIGFVASNHDPVRTRYNNYKHEGRQAIQNWRNIVSRYDKIAEFLRSLEDVRRSLKITLIA